MAAPATPSYDPAATVKKLEELDKLLPDVKASEQQEKFQKVQVFLKKNNQLIVEVMKKQEESTTNTEAANDKKSLQKVAEMIKELNENLTQIYQIYAELAPVKDD